MIALQRTLMQTDDKVIRLLPAWPRHWNVAFRLHAPYKTTVEGIYEHGELIELNITPAWRAKDIVKLPTQSPPL